MCVRREMTWLEAQPVLHEISVYKTRGIARFSALKLAESSVKQTKNVLKTLSRVFNLVFTQMERNRDIRFIAAREDVLCPCAQTSRNTNRIQRDTHGIWPEAHNLYASDVAY